MCKIEGKGDAYFLQKIEVTDKTHTTSAYCSNHTVIRKWMAQPYWRQNDVDPNMDIRPLHLHTNPMPSMGGGSSCLNRMVTYP